MAFIAGPADVDNSSVNSGYGPPCNYPGNPLAGTPVISPNVSIGGAPLTFYHASGPPNVVIGAPLTPPGVCTPGIRTIVPQMNTTVKVNNKLVGVTGDLTNKAGSFTGGPRYIAGAGLHPTVILNTKNYVPPSGP